MEEKIQENRIRINVKQNFKGEKGWEFTVRGDTKEEVAQLKADAEDLVK